MNEFLALLALVTDAYGGRGGIAQYNRDFLGALAEANGVSSILVVPRQAPDPVSPPVGVRQFAAHAGRVAYTLAALRIALSWNVDVVFCGHLYLAPLARLLARLKRARLIMQVHGVEAWERPGGLVRKAVEGADLVLCVSRHTRHAVLGWAALAPERAIVLPNTVGDAFTPGDGAELRTAWKLDGKRVLLTVGRLPAAERYKGHDRVIRALPQLIAGGLDVVYVIAGDGDDRQRLEDLAAQEGISDRVRFVGALDGLTLVEAYRMADLFVMPSTGEGFGIAFLEAMACGTPAVGLAAAGARDALADGALGATTSVADLPETLSRMLADANLDRRALSEAVMKRFGRHVFNRRAVSAVNHRSGGPASRSGSW